jgi:NTE family protein
LIAGNPPDARLKQLRAFWEQVSSTVLGDPVLPGDAARSWFNEVSAAWVASFGVTGFFSPRFPPAFLYPPGWPQALSYYDTSSLRSTLERLIDFDRINARETRLSVGAVNVRTGNFIYFDNARERIRPDHIMASAALPPGFPPVEIDGECYWDGGLVSNTPLDYVLDKAPRQDLLIFQVDLFPARGPMPRTLIEVDERAKDIRYSSRTRLNTDANIAMHQARAALHRILHHLPVELRSDPDITLLEDFSRENAVTVMQLIYRRRNYERASKDYEFSRSTMREHWASGWRDVRHSLLHRDWRDWLARRRPEGGVAVFDLPRDATD